ncbi:MAG: hypothetical protein PHO63_01125 [Bacilli bacterium]|nr:hypothetical protein [Bacilli bacterium]MDD4808459.1 hypothetical protein [Bacilli bacterium]
MTCKNGDKVGVYTVIEDEGSDWSELASKMFYNEFGIYPTECSRGPLEKI